MAAERQRVIVHLNENDGAMKSIRIREELLKDGVSAAAAMMNLVLTSQPVHFNEIAVEEGVGVELDGSEQVLL